ncbi:PAAR-like domain-containing protein [Massilia sp. METH4]|uniref:PAAR-like domain-containing protein n=1 Tax=Massilia sp. METH4 TaxID=3123041 RepID=UPI0030D0E809
MANETVTKSKRFYCVSMVPDICKTPVGSSVVPIPYTITGEFADAQSVSSNVKTHGEPVLLHGRSFIPAVKGDERGTVGGIKSGTNLKKVETQGNSSTKGANGAQTVQESRLVWMNNRNTIGRIYERGVKPPRSRLQKLGDMIAEGAKDAAQYYKDNVSADMHELGQDAMDVGGKVAVGSTVAMAAGGVMVATGVGAAPGAVVVAGGTIGRTAGGVATGAGYATDATATLLDNAADMVLTGKMPDVAGALGDMAWSAAENIGLNKLGGAGGWLKGLLKGRKGVPGKTPKPPARPPAKAGNDKDGHDGGKIKQDKPPKNDKPSDCCPKDGAPGGKSVKSAHPVHFGTGEEILPQTDFVLDGPTPLDWTRVYRSGSETEDWGLLGARWATPYTSSISVCAQGTVYHEASGRALRLPALAPGEQHDHRGEGFILRRDSEARFTLIWRDGSTDTFDAGPDGWLPHGYDGVNAMKKPGDPVRTRRFYLARRAERDGTGITIERHHDARPGEVLLRVRTDDGLTIEALRDAWLPAELEEDRPSAPRIGQVDQVLPDGTRICHARYRYEADAPAPADAVPGTFDALPRRCDLVEQTTIAGQSRTYGYEHHLLVRYTTYSGFAHGLHWVSLAFLRERWAGIALDDAALIARNPIGIHNSYQARAVRTTTADGRNEVAIAYLDEDTTRVTEPDGGLLEYTFDANWLATKVRRIGSDGSPRSLGRRAWDRDGMLLADIDADGAETRYAYDAAGNLVTVTDAQGHVTRIDYDSANLPVTVTDALGHATHSRYDGAGRLVERTDALGRRTGYAYDDKGRLVTVTDAKGGTKRLGYDDAGRLASYTDCSGFTSSYRYDAANRVAEQVDAMGNVTAYRYDIVGRVVEIIQPDGTTERFDYDADSNLLAHTDAKGQRMRYRYDGHGLLVERIDAKEQRLGYRYDKALRVTELINGNDESYFFSYDAEGRLTSETGFDGKVTKYVYSAAGHLVATESAGVRADFARDPLGRLLAKSTTDGAVRYAYDPLGRLIATSTREAKNRFLYDAVGQLIDERMAYSPGPPPLPGQEVEPIAAFAMTHAYDELGNRIQTIMPNGRRIDILRYGSGHWHGTLWNGKTIVDLERDHLHREVVRELGSGSERLTERRSYDPQSRLSSFTLERGRERLRERHYEYDLFGNLVHIDDKVRGSIRYTYDPLGQLLSAVQPGLTETFAFDPAGNLLDPETAAAPIDTRQVLRELDEQPTAGTRPPRIAKVTHNLLRQYMGYAYEYDVQGNTVVKRPKIATVANEEGVLTFSYDSENRMTMAVRTFATSRIVARYSYDAFGRRIAKRVDEQRWAEGEEPPAIGQAHTGKLTLFVWDGDVMVQEIVEDKTVTYLYEPESFVPMAKVESADNCHVTPKPQLYFLSNLQPVKHARMSLGETFVAESGNNFAAEYRDKSQYQRIEHNKTFAAERIFHYQCDHLGTPLELMDAQGSVIWAAQYRSWGSLCWRGGNMPSHSQPLRFQGQYHDDETNLFYNRNRFYDPDCGRFVTQDPIGLVGGVNSYTYSPNPVVWTDPLGLNADRLRRNLRRAGRPVPPEKTPHHIVQENCEKNLHVQGARRILQLEEIDIDSASNGARLWGTNPSQEAKGNHPGKTAAIAQGNRHSGAHVHSDLNDKLIYQILRNARNRGVNVENVLRDIGARMESGEWKRTFDCCCSR